MLSLLKLPVKSTNPNARNTPMGPSNYDMPTVTWNNKYLTVSLHKVWSAFVFCLATTINNKYLWN